MAKPLKVWAGEERCLGKFRRTILATKSKTSAMRILNVGRAYFRDYWSETDLPKEVEAARAIPGEILYETYDRSDLFKTADWLARDVSLADTMRDTNVDVTE